MFAALNRSPALVKTSKLDHQRHRHHLLALLLAIGAAALWLPGGYRELAGREQLVFGALVALAVQR